jgi:dihydroflavonol-4-reductase
MNIDTTKPVMVTGATGYVAGRLVERLLSEGLTVHAAVRTPNNTDKLKYLNAIAEKSKGTIKYFKADLLNDGSYLEAMKGCEVVFHTASPFSLNIKDAQKELIDPALKGTRNVLETANKTPSVKTVVVTSSCAAIYGDSIDVLKMPNKELSEEVWNTTSSLTHQPYSYSKTLAEKEAWKIAEAQTQWKLVTINPSFVLGPGINPFGTSETFTIMKQLSDGTMKMGAPDMEIGVVDVRDLAEAHFRAGYKPEAHGRNIISGKDSSFLEIAGILNKAFPKYPFPKNTIPKFLIWLIAPAIGMTRAMVSKNVGYAWSANNSKSKKELGMTYRPLKETLVDFFKQLEEAGVIKKK